MRSIPSFVTERNNIIKKNGKKFGFIHPATYDIAMTGMTAITLSNLVNSLETWRFERVFLPWNPLIEPNSMENHLTLSNMDIIGFTSQFEPDYLIVGWMLKKAKIPLDNKTRKKSKQSFPPLFVGGPCAGGNPFPLLDFVDGFFLGDAENSLPTFLKLVDEKGIDKFWNDPALFNGIKGFWTPHALESHNKPYSTVFEDKKFEEVAGEWYSRFDFVTLDATPYPIKQTFCTLPTHHPYAPVKGQAFQLEIGRGCSHACRFCMIGSGMFSPARYRSLERLLQIAQKGLQLTGVNKIDIFGTNLSDFPQLNDLCWTLVNEGIELSIATLRPDKVSDEIIEAVHNGGQSKITIAPETGSEKLRYKLCKKISNDRVLEATETIFENGIPMLKNFFLTGLPKETDEDRLAIIELVKKQRHIAKDSNLEDIRIKVDINPMVPKWQTPLKNWVNYFLPENRLGFQETLIKMHTQLNTLSYIRAKKVSFNEFLAQTWLTHLEGPINMLFDSLKLRSHAPLSIHGGHYFLNDFKDLLDSILETIWNEFKRSHWKVNHRVRATNHSDEIFTKHYVKINE
jgi:radical SAM superfamily enzyme YgiQ (UPF0313 family)